MSFTTLVSGTPYYRVVCVSVVCVHHILRNPFVPFSLFSFQTLVVSMKESQGKFIYFMSFYIFGSSGQVTPSYTAERHFCPQGTGIEPWFTIFTRYTRSGSFRGNLPSYRYVSQLSGVAIAIPARQAT